jgi:hypothetical protein
MIFGGFSLWSLGALLGLRHALELDHLAAVSTVLASERNPRAAAGLGAAWGLGHTLALLAVACVLAATQATLPAKVGTMFELAVGVMLMGLGARSIGRVFLERRPARIAIHAPRPGQPHLQESHWTFARRSLLIGLVHGLAGSGALTAMIAAQLPSTGLRLAYVGLFGLCSMAGMAGLSGLAGMPLARLGRKRGVRAAVGLLAGTIASIVGVMWTVREVASL